MDMDVRFTMVAGGMAEKSSVMIVGKNGISINDNYNKYFI
jgi:hypothetical protein